MRVALASLALSASLTGIASSADAAEPPATIDFEQPAIGNPDDFSDDFSYYTSLGMTITNAFGIVRDDARTNWGLVGTNGRQFIGSNAGATMTIAFSEPQSFFSIDCARSAGSPTGLEMAVQLRNGIDLVAQVGVTFGDIDVWQTITIPGPINYNTIEFPTNGQNYGCDNLRLAPAKLPPSGSNTMPTVALAAALLAAGALLTVRRRSAA